MVSDCTPLEEFKTKGLRSCHEKILRYVNIKSFRGKKSFRNHGADFMA